MGNRKVSILEPAATAVAEIAWLIESKGLSKTAKKFVNEVFEFFTKLSDNRAEHKNCSSFKKHNEINSSLYSIAADGV